MIFTFCNGLTPLEKVECLLWAISEHSPTYALPPIQQASESDISFWEKVLDISGLKNQGMSFHEFAILLNGSRHVKELTIFGERMTNLEKPSSWLGHEIKDGDYHRSITRIQREVGAMLFTRGGIRITQGGQPYDSLQEDA